MCESRKLVVVEKREGVVVGGGVKTSCGSRGGDRDHTTCNSLLYLVKSESIFFLSTGALGAST